MDIFEDIEETLATLRDIVVELPKRYEMNEQMIKKLDDECNDIAHYMEFCDLDAAKGYQAYKDMQKLRKERRLLKNENELIDPAISLLKELNKFDQRLNFSIGKVRKVKEVHGVRRYRVRVRQDLDEMINKNRAI